MSPTPAGVVISYDYGDCPTIAKFAASNAFIRGLLGPFRCLPGDTEFLTPTGWKRLDAYTPGDLAAQWHPETNEINYVFPTAYINEPAKDFIEFDSGMVTMRLSEGHRVPHYNWDGRFQVKTAAEIESRPSRRKIPVTFAIPYYSGLGMSDELMRVAVMMHADGYYPKEGLKVAVCVRKERKKARIRQLLTAINTEWTEHTYPARPTETTFRFVSPYGGKHFDSWWWQANPDQLAVVLDEARYWDGNIHPDHSGFKYFTVHKADADFIQYAAHATGKIATIRTQEYEQENWKTGYIVHILDEGSYKACATIRAETTITRVPALNGRQYCFNVPTGFFVARCDDSIFITGNSGKSSGCVAEIMRRSISAKPGTDGIKRSRWLVVRSTTPQLEDTTIRTFHMWVPPQHFGRYYESDHTYHIKAIAGCDIEIMFRALDRPEHVRNLLSLEVTGAWVNEAREVPWAIIEALQGRVGQYPSKAMGGLNWQGIIMDTNPPDVDSKWYKFFEEDKHPSGFAEIFRQPSGLSPLAENLNHLTSKDYYKNLAIGKTPEWIKVYIDGQYGFVIDGKPVYTEYNDKAHCRDLSPMKGVTIYRGWDFGLTPACVFSQLLPDGRWLIFDEVFSETTMGADRFSDEVITFCGEYYPGAEFRDIGDPAGESRAQTDEKTCFQILQAKGIDIEGGEQSPAIRIESVRKPLRTMIQGEPQFAIHPRCKMLRKGFLGAYKYRRMNVTAERYTPKPEKDQYSHPHDALQYVATRLFGSGLTSMQQMGEAFLTRTEPVSEVGRSNYTGY